MVESPQRERSLDSARLWGLLSQVLEPGALAGRLAGGPSEGVTRSGSPVVVQGAWSLAVGYGAPV